MFFCSRSWTKPNTSCETSWAPFIRTELACDTAWRFWDERRASSSACGPLKPSTCVNWSVDALEGLRGRVQALTAGCRGRSRCCGGTRRLRRERSAHPRERLHRSRCEPCGRPHQRPCSDRWCCCYVDIRSSLYKECISSAEQHFTQEQICLLLEQSFTVS